MSDPDYDFLNEEAPDEVVPEKAPQDTPEPVAETVDTPETPAPEVPTTPEHREETVPLAALRAEREKRQRIEQQLRQYQQNPQFDPSVFHQDPSSIQHFVEQRLTAERFNLSRTMAAAQFEDYSDMEELFIEEAEKNPALRAELIQSENPALFAYQTAKSLQTLREAKSGDLEKRLRSEIEARVRAEYEAKASKAPVSVPPDLSNTRSAAVEDAPVDESLDSILKSKR
jgi:hypothetical protein